MKKVSILIVDDEENVSKLLSKVLKKEGFITYSADNGITALEIINHRDIDIVITDIKMPVMDGIELLENIRKIDQSIRVILITAFATLETAVGALRLGASDYIIKPFNLEDITNAVKKIIPNIDKEDIIFDVDMENIHNGIFSNSIAMKETLDMAKQVAHTKATVMLYGETGVGKSIVANLIHRLSARQGGPFIKVNCAAIPDNLLESEFFGYEKGAFTGALVSKPGKFELANEGTIFLDEIGDIPLPMQVKLLRVIQDREFERLGGINTIKVDVRIIAATNKNLLNMVETGQFREDLFYRLNVVPINIPPLRERKEDIPYLVKEFLLESSEITGLKPKSITEAAVDKLINYCWPGNIRELQNVIERCVVINKDEVISEKIVPDYILNYVGEKSCNFNNEGILLENVIDITEEETIIKALKNNNGNRTNAAKSLGISRRSLHRKILKYNIQDI